MKEGTKISVRTIVGGLLFAALLPVGNAFAQDAKAYREDINRYQTRVDQVRVSGETARYEAELSQISSWIEESLVLIGKDEMSEVKWLSVKIGVYIDFVEASMARDKAMGKALESESALKSLKAEYGKLEAEVQQLSAEKDLLQKQLDELNAAKVKK